MKEKQKKYAIGKTFIHKGKTYECVEEENNYEGCIGCEISCCGNIICHSLARKDVTGVIFKEIKDDSFLIEHFSYGCFKDLRTVVLKFINKPAIKVLSTNFFCSYDPNMHRNSYECSIIYKLKWKEGGKK